MSNCSSEANHLGNPLLLPISAVSTGIENASYDARRSKVKRYVSTNRAVIHQEIESGGGAKLRTAMDLARVPLERRKALLRELSRNAELYVHRDIEPLVVALMVHGT